MGATNGTWRCGDGEWVKGNSKHGFLAFVHAVNRLCDEQGIEHVFGEPTSLGDWWVPGMYAEEYPRARIIYTKGDMPERMRRAEGYRIVTDDQELWPMWEQAAAIVEPTLEMRSSWDPSKP
jgi:hypothetical protein